MAVSARKIQVLQKALQASAATASVLVVDDEELNRDLLSRRLLRAGFDVEVAADGEQALALVDAMSIDLVLLDVMMPGISGYTVLERLRERYSADSLPVIMVTARTDSSDIVGALERGANDYVSKPIDFSELKARIDTQLQLLAAKAVLRRSKEELEELVEQRTADLRESQARFRSLYDNTPSIFLTVNSRGRILSANAFGLSALGYSADEITQIHSADLFPELQPQPSTHAFQQCEQVHGKVFRWQTSMVRKSGESIPANVSARCVTNRAGSAEILVVCEDTSEIQRLTSKLSFEMRHDHHTGLINRRTFEEQLNKMVIESHADSGEAGHAVFVICIDRSSLVNGAMGRSVLDEQVLCVAKILSTEASDLVLPARLDNDRFGVLCKECNDHEASIIANRILQSVRSTEFVWGDSRIDLSASIGVALFYPGDNDAVAVIRQADIACDQALERGGDRCRLYRKSEDPMTLRRGDLIWLTRIKEALAGDRFVLYAQAIRPLADSADDAPHYEVLVRMLGTDNGVIEPGAFLPAVEKYGLSAQLDQWVVRNLLRWLAENEDHVAELSMCSVNLSGLSIGDPVLLDFLLREIPASAVAPSKLCLEITETAAIANMNAAGSFITALRELGCRFALDDFGSGLSSFAYLRDLPVDFVKIDGAFVRDIATDPVHRAMVESINDVAHVMDKQTIAEFVDDEKTVAELRRIGVDYAQGYLFDEPGPLDARVTKQSI